MKKRIFATLLAIGMVISLTACGGGSAAGTGAAGGGAGSTAGAAADAGDSFAFSFN